MIKHGRLGDRQVPAIFLTTIFLKTQGYVSLKENLAENIRVYVKYNKERQLSK